MFEYEREMVRAPASGWYWPPLTLALGPRGLGTGAPLPARRHLTGASHSPLALLSTSIQLASTKLVTNVPIEITGGNKCQLLKCAIIIVKVRLSFKRSGLIMSAECPVSIVSNAAIFNQL